VSRRHQDGKPNSDFGGKRGGMLFGCYLLTGSGAAKDKRAWISFRDVSRSKAKVAADKHGLAWE
jgi:hypothetical protein